MSAPAFKVGDLVQVVEPTGPVGSRARRLVRETSTLWIDEYGNRWRKRDGYLTPHHLARRIVLAEVQP